MKISKKEINYIIKQYNYICESLRAQGNELSRFATLNVINDYITILKDERITENQENQDCYNLIYTICTELDEYENNNNFIDYYEEETSKEVKQLYFNILINMTERKENKRCCSECNKEMNKGYCIENGMEYYCSEECLHKNYTEEDFLEMYDDGNGDSYYTEWEC